MSKGEVLVVQDALFPNIDVEHSSLQTDFPSLTFTVRDYYISGASTFGFTSK